MEASPAKMESKRRLQGRCRQDEKQKDGDDMFHGANIKI
jgi:hypothetical protein